MTTTTTIAINPVLLYGLPDNIISHIYSYDDTYNKILTSSINTLSIQHWTSIFNDWIQSFTLHSRYFIEQILLTEFGIAPHLMEDFIQNHRGIFSSHYDNFHDFMRDYQHYQYFRIYCIWDDQFSIYICYSQNDEVETNKYTLCPLTPTPMADIDDDIEYVIKNDKFVCIRRW